MTGLAVPDASGSINLLPIESVPVRRPLGLACLLALSLLGLNGPASAGVAPDAVQALGQDFAIAVGASARIGKTDLVVHFDRVVNILRREFEMAMALTGRTSVAQIEASVIWK